MAVLEWDVVGERSYETGVDHGVLYLPDDSGDYNDAESWNGIVKITESPSGAGATPTYADNIKYLNLIAAELFGATIEAYTYPDKFAECDGTAVPVDGVFIGQQTRKKFGLCYRSQKGNDIEGTDFGYKIHLVYGAQAEPSARDHDTINDTPSAITFSWVISTSPVPVTDHKPTALITIDSTKVDSDALATLLDILYGTESVDPRLPLPDEVISIFEGTLTEVRLVGSNAPTYNAGTHIVTLPAVTGIVWRINGVVTPSGAQPAMSVGETSIITASPESGYTITGDDDWTFDY